MTVERLDRVRLALRARALGPSSDAPTDWEQWLRLLYPRAVDSFADHHATFWDWLWSIKAGRPRPFIGVWARGGGKSTSAELGAAALGIRDIRRYALYIRETQEQADNSVANIAALLESPTVAQFYPAHADRLLSKYGTSRGWRRNRLRTAGGFTVDAIGLDTAARGAKVEDQRPDLLILDDIDGRHDGDVATLKKITTLTRSLLPTGTENAAIMGIQNLIIPNGVFTRLVDDRADFLIDRIVSGPHPALLGLKTERVWDERLQKLRARILEGTPTWLGQDVAACQNRIDTDGLSAFLEECQHMVHEREGALWKRSILDEFRVMVPVSMRRVVVGVDPSGGREEIGIVVAGIGRDGRGYVMADNTQPGHLGPANWGNHAVGAYDEHKADRIIAEKNYGGDMVASTIQVAASGRIVPVRLVTASRGKAIRAEPVAALYEEGRVSHVGRFPDLEAEMTGWVQTDPDSPNRLDALVWALTDLMLTGGNVQLSGDALGHGFEKVPEWRIE